MGRGGYRQGAGRKAGWKHGATQTIRVPIALREQLLEIVRQLDNGEFICERTHSELNALLGEWQTKCNAQPTDSLEWQKARQLLGEIKELLSPEAVMTDQQADIETDELNECLGRREAFGHGHRRHHGRFCG